MKMKLPRCRYMLSSPVVTDSPSVSTDSLPPPNVMTSCESSSNILFKWRRVPRIINPGAIIQSPIKALSFRAARAPPSRGRITTRDRLATYGALRTKLKTNRQALTLCQGLLINTPLLLQNRPQVLDGPTRH